MGQSLHKINNYQVSPTSAWTSLSNICSTAAKTEMALGVLERDFQSLQDRCIEVILSQLTQEEQIYSPELPVRKKHFISEGLEDFQEDVALAVNNHNINLSHW